MSSATSGEGQLPDYTVRRSARARRVRLTVTPRDGLVVVVPSGVGERVARDAVRAKATWARRALDDVASHRELLVAGPDALLPSTVEFAAVGESWVVEYRTTTASGVRGRVSAPGRVTLAGDVEDAAACLDALRRWRDRTAADRLPMMLQVRAAELGVGYERVSVRGQRTRWGSCSSAGTISLNRDLLFLPERLVDYVIVHELAHRVHPNHSRHFHELVNRWRPDSRRVRSELRGAWRHVPAWAM